MATVNGEIRELYIFTDEENDELGIGTNGTVFRDISKSNGHNVAIKLVEISRAFKNEIEICLECDHPNVMKATEVLQDSKNVYFIFPLMQETDLFYSI